MRRNRCSAGVSAGGGSLRKAPSATAWSRKASRMRPQYRCRSSAPKKSRFCPSVLVVLGSEAALGAAHSFVTQQDLSSGESCAAQTCLVAPQMRFGAELCCFALVSLMFGCRSTQSLRDDCISEASVVCPACDRDEDCMIVSNRCLASAACTHVRRDPPLSVVAVGCNIEYDRPPASSCGCVEGVCRGR